MADIYKFEDERSASETGKEFRIPPRTWIVWLAIFGGIISLMVLRDKLEFPTQNITQHRFEELLDEGRIVHATINYDPQRMLTEIVGKYADNINGAKVELPFRTLVRLGDSMEQRLLSLPQFETHQPNTMLLSVFWSVPPILVIATLIWFFFIRRIRIVNSPSTYALQSKASQQLERFDQILDKWEKQADRMEELLRKLERGSGPR
jgi:ATP-dependent Zn protease